ncbi:MAG: hypothetical protein ACK2T4_09325 [Candidatus Promineifilaceae bacterium]|jgi:hypothetical protein
MNKSPFIWLGAGRAKKRGVARRGRHLDDAARAGLPVPEGAILLDELFRIFLREGVIERVGDKIIVPDPIWLLEVFYRDVRFPRLQKTVDIHVILPDEYEGWLPPGAAAKNVDLEDAAQLAAALSQLWSYPAQDDEFRRDLSLVANMTYRTAGRVTAFSNSRDVVYNLTSAANGGDEMETISLPRLGKWQRPSQEYEPSMRRLQMLLRGIRRTLRNEDAFDFYWRDDGQVCWIVLFN